MMRDVTVELGKLGQAPGQAFCQSAIERILAQLCAALHSFARSSDSPMTTGCRLAKRERDGARKRELVVEANKKSRYEQMLSRWKLS